MSHIRPPKPPPPAPNRKSDTSTPSKFDWKSPLRRSTEGDKTRKAGGVGSELLEENDERLDSTSLVNAMEPTDNTESRDLPGSRDWTGSRDSPGSRELSESIKDKNDDDNEVVNGKHGLIIVIFSFS